MSTIRLPSVPKGLKELTIALLSEQKKGAERALSVLATMPGAESQVAEVVDYLNSNHRFQQRVLEKEIQVLRTKLNNCSITGQVLATGVEMLGGRLDTCTELPVSGSDRSDAGSVIFDPSVLPILEAAEHDGEEDPG